MSIENSFDKPPITPQPEKELSPEELREKFRDPSYLPTRKEIFQAFPGSQGWHDFCYNEDNPVFEFLNEEFLNSLSDYLAQRAEDLGASEYRSITILEVGAGNGRLSHFLQQKLEAKIPRKVKIIATDSGEENVKIAFPVEIINHTEALKKYKPEIVICSWMPFGIDFTADFRETPSVQEYILIGETDYGCCGHPWLTWGFSLDLDKEKELAPYEADGFNCDYLKNISEHQICRTDRLGEYYHSQTVSFKRRKTEDGNNLLDSHLK